MKLPIPLVSSLLYYLYRFLCATLRFREFGREEVDALDAAGERLVFCLWHDELFPLMHVQRQLDAVTVVSASKDGELLAGVLERLGLRTARGSSGRGGVKALLSASRMMKKENVHACLTVDGPRGPRHQAKDGAIFLGQHADAYILPVRLRISPSVRVKSWDRFQVPVPFGRVEVYFGQPWKLPPGDMDKAFLDAGRSRLEADLERLGRGWPDPMEESRGS